MVDINGVSGVVDVDGEIASLIDWQSANNWQLRYMHVIGMRINIILVRDESFMLKFLVVLIILRQFESLTILVSVFAFLMARDSQLEAYIYINLIRFLGVSLSTDLLGVRRT